MRAFRAVAVVGMAYEATALLSRLPTVTSLVHGARTAPLPVYATSVVVVVVGLSLTGWHLLAEGW